MRTSPRFIATSLIAFVLCAASIGVAHAQQEAATPNLGKVPSGLSFAFDAQQGQFSASGLHMNAAKPKSASITPTTGTIDVTLTINLVSKFSHDTVFPCAVIAIGGVIDLNSATVDGGVETVYGRGMVASPGATTATCTVSIPYSWTLPGGSTSSGLILAYAAAAVHEHGGTKRSTLQVSGIENLPANGTTSKFAFEVAL